MIQASRALISGMVINFRSILYFIAPRFPQPQSDAQNNLPRQVPESPRRMLAAYLARVDRDDYAVGVAGHSAGHGSTRTVIPFLLHTAIQSAGCRRPLSACRLFLSRQALNAAKLSESSVRFPIRVSVTMHGTSNAGHRACAVFAVHAHSLHLLGPMVAAVGFTDDFDWQGEVTPSPSRLRSRKPCQSPNADDRRVNHFRIVTGAIRSIFAQNLDCFGDGHLGSSLKKNSGQPLISSQTLTRLDGARTSFPVPRIRIEYRDQGDNVQPLVTLSWSADVSFTPPPDARPEIAEPTNGPDILSGNRGRPVPANLARNQPLLRIRNVKLVYGRRNSLDAAVNLLHYFYMQRSGANEPA